MAGVYCVAATNQRHRCCSCHGDCRHFCGMIDGLAFLPLSDVRAGMQYLKSVATDQRAALTELRYFDATYTCPARFAAFSANGSAAAICLKRMPPAYPPHIWNVGYIQEATIITRYGPITSVNHGTMDSLLQWNKCIHASGQRSKLSRRTKHVQHDAVSEWTRSATMHTNAYSANLN